MADTIYRMKEYGETTDPREYAEWWQNRYHRVPKWLREAVNAMEPVEEPVEVEDPELDVTVEDPEPEPEDEEDIPVIFRPVEPEDEA